MGIIFLATVAHNLVSRTVTYIRSPVDVVTKTVHTAMALRPTRQLLFETCTIKVSLSTHMLDRDEFV